MYYNWRTLLDMRPTDTACALIRWQHFSASNGVNGRDLKSMASYEKSDSVNRCVFT